MDSLKSDIKQMLENYKSIQTEPTIYSQKLLVNIHDKYTEFKDVEDNLEDEIDNAFNNMKKWEKIHEEKTNKLKELYKNPIIILSP
jgi:CII-binding regulator of phage lambda lysogenization HflD